MESKRRMIFKKEISQIQERKEEPESSEILKKYKRNKVPINKPRRTKSPVNKCRINAKKNINSDNIEVTLLGSPSYHEQNKIPLSSANCSKKDERHYLMQIEEFNNENTGNNNVLEKLSEEGNNTLSYYDTDLEKENDITMKDYYDTFINIIEVELEKEETNDVTSEAETNENTIKVAEKDPEISVINVQTEDIGNIIIIDDLNRKEPEKDEKINDINPKENEEVAIIQSELSTFKEFLLDEQNKTIKTKDKHEVISMPGETENIKAFNTTIISDSILRIDMPNEIQSSISIENKKSLEEDVGDKEPSTSNSGKKSKRAINKSYVDFLSEDEEFFWDSTSWKETGEDTSSSEQEKPKKKKKKNVAEDGKVGEKGMRKKKQNKRKEQKESKNKGKSYLKKGDVLVKGKELKQNPCIGKSCGHKCEEINEEKRQALFNYFWNLTSQRKKEWLVAMSTKKDVKRKRSKDSSYRQQTFNYFINDGEGRRQVCQKFIIYTLNITQRYIYYTLTTTTSQGIAKEDARGKTVPYNKTPNLVRESAKDFLKALPALPSHYCRKDTTRLYLPTEYKNLKNLYRTYKEDWRSKGRDVVSENLFRDIFNKDFNIGFHTPKKDKCLKCLKFEGQNIEAIPELKEHLAEKKASKIRFEFHRELGKENPSILCASFDLQKVLNTPHGKSMLLFYSRKYAVYNLCVYESITRNGFCYVWGETEGKRGGNEVATILQKYVENIDSRGSIKTLILYCDSCPGQNRNKIVLAALHNALLQSKNIETLQINYLLPGHTEMTVDSIHSTIESSIRNTIVWAPSQWLTICQLARKEPKPYNVEPLTHDDFKNFDNLSDKYFKGNLAGKINKIRTATFKKSSPNIIKIKFSMQKNVNEEKVPIISKPKAINSCYKTLLPITKSKYNDLKKLCETGAIPKIFHKEYLSFPNGNGRDELIDTDIEDETEE